MRQLILLTCPDRAFAEWLAKQLVVRGLVVGRQLAAYINCLPGRYGASIEADW